jgi:predicted nucleic acid-binding protein
MVLEAAVNGRADGLVTFNDRDFLPVRAEFNIRIFSPRDLIRKLEKK